MFARAAPQIAVIAIASRGDAGTPVEGIYSTSHGRVGPKFEDLAKANLAACDVVFFAASNGIVIQQASVLLDAVVLIIDLVADFRIKDVAEWKKWFGMPRACPDWVEKAVYGLPEVNRERIRLAANPGCYPIAVQLGFMLLAKAGLVDTSSLIAEAASGVSGAGCKAETHILFSEVFDNFKAYVVPGHRHLPEICQGLSYMAGTGVGVTFVPYLVPMIRGIYAALYARIKSETDFKALFESAYANELFVDVLPAKSHPETRSVRSANPCRIAAHRLQGGDMLVVLSAIDNLAKGVARQAIQSMNLMFDLDEAASLC